MPFEKEPLQCIPVLPIKTEIDRIACDIKLHASDIFTETWNRYPCKLNSPQKCQNDHCNGKVSFFIINNSSKGVKILRLFFIRQDEKAYVHCDQQLRSLFDAGILPRFDPVTIHFKKPAISEPTKRVFPKT